MASPDSSGERPRARNLGVAIGTLSPAPLNAITDVAGVRVGHHTLIEGQNIRTGVTVILPHGGNLFKEKVPAAIVVGNGFGKLVGSTQVEELGVLETPIVLTNTLSVFAAAEALVSFSLSLPGYEQVWSINPIVAETNDGYLNDIRAMRVGREEVRAALTSARGGPVPEGSVGAGAGTRCMGFKGGIGTASRRVPSESEGYVVGVLVQTNFGGLLTVGGAPVGRELGGHCAQDAADQRRGGGGSCIIVVATDAPLDSRQLRRLGARALLGLAGAGSSMSHGSGDYAIAFSTSQSVRAGVDDTTPVRSMTLLRDERLSPLFQAAREATEEAILNSLLRATSVTGVSGNTCDAVPIDRFVEICKRYGVIRR